MSRLFQFSRILSLIGLATLLMAEAPEVMANAERQPNGTSELSIPGPKRTVAVGDIQAGGGFEIEESWDVGSGLSSMLTTALVKSGRFLVLERTTLSAILNEQQLAASKVTGGNPSRERLIPAQFLIVGSVTQFGTPKRGGGLSIGSASGGLLGGLGLSRKVGKVELDVRLVNSRTGQIVESFTVAESVSKTGIALQSNYRGIAFGGDQFFRTPLGEATRKALDQVVERVSQALSRTKWEGRVVEVEGTSVIVNAGAEAGMTSGNSFRIERPGRALTDPATGQVLRESRGYVGNVLILSVEPTYSIGEFSPAAAALTPVRGDFVVPDRGGP